MSVPTVCPSVHKMFFFDLNENWYVGRDHVAVSEWSSSAADDGLSVMIDNCSMVAADTTQRLHSLIVNG